MTTPETRTLRTALCAEQWRRERAEMRAASTADERVAAAEASEATMLATLTAAQDASTRDLGGVRAARRELAAVRVLLDAATMKIGILHTELEERLVCTVPDDHVFCAWCEEHAENGSAKAPDWPDVQHDASCPMYLMNGDAIRDSQMTPGHAAIAPLLALRDEIDGARAACINCGMSSDDPRGLACLSGAGPQHDWPEAQPEGTGVHAGDAAEVEILYFKPSGKYYTTDEKTLWPRDASHHSGWAPVERVARIKGMIAVCINAPQGFPQMHVPRVMVDAAHADEDWRLSQGEPPCPECGERDCGGAPRFAGKTLDERIAMRCAEPDVPKELAEEQAARIAELEQAARAVAHEVDTMLAGGGDGGLEQCHECDLGPIGSLRDSMYELRPLLTAPTLTETAESCKTPSPHEPSSSSSAASPSPSSEGSSPHGGVTADDDGPVPCRDTPEVNGWAVNVIDHPGGLRRTVFSVGVQHFTIGEADGDDAAEHCEAMRMMFLTALGRLGVTDGKRCCVKDCVSPVRAHEEACVEHLIELAVELERQGQTNPRCYHPTSAMGCTLCDREWRARHRERTEYRP